MENNRLKKIRHLLNERNGKNLLVSNYHNIYYLTGFRGLSPHERESFALVTPQKCFLVIPEMYREQAEKTVGKEVTLLVDSERDGLFVLALRQCDKNSALFIEENDLTAAEYQYVHSTRAFQIEFAGGIIERLRAVKDSEELTFIRKAVHCTDQLFDRIYVELKKSDTTKITENQLAHMMRGWVSDLGGDGFGFDPIVSSGSGSSQPHYKTANKHITSGPLLIDFGVDFGGYTGDLTRTIYVGEPHENFTKMYNLVLECNRLCIEKCKPGIPAYTLHETAVDFFKKHGLEGHFIHGLGHGVGLDIHEEPFFRSGRETILEPGMIITIEPGLYFAGEYGIRIEDYVLITDTGCEVLSTAPKELLTV